jgi:hypothetical protein
VTVLEMGTNRITAALAWMAAHNAWADAERRLVEQLTRGASPAHLEEEVVALKAEAEALFVAATRTTSDFDSVAPAGIVPPATVLEMGTATLAWMAAHNAWADADRRLMDQNKKGIPPTHLEEEVATLKAEADALFAAATEELRRTRAA